MRNKRKHKSGWKKKAERWGQETRLRPEGDGWHQRGDIHLFRELRSNMLTRQTGGVTVDQLLLLHHVPSRTSPLTPIIRRIFNSDATSNRWGPAEESEQSWFSCQRLVLVLFFSFYISQNLSENESVSLWQTNHSETLSCTGWSDAAVQGEWQNPGPSCCSHSVTMATTHYTHRVLHNMPRGTLGRAATNWVKPENTFWSFWGLWGSFRPRIKSRKTAERKSSGWR